MRTIVWIPGAAWALLAGCTLPAPAPDTALPAAPAQWQHAPPSAATAQAPLPTTWWRSFGSPELSALVEQAAVDSHDLAAAAARLRQAQASAGIAGAALWPALNATVAASREGRLGGNASVDGTSLAVGLNASYEVDLWGRLRALDDSARARLQASRFAQGTLQLSVSASVAQAWMLAVALQERSALAARSLASAERLLALVDARARAGAATALELAQQRSLVASQQRTLQGLRQQGEAARTALAVLLGQTTPVALQTTSLASLAPPEVPLALPSALLARRPDIAEAEARLAAAAADVAAARAALLPSLSLNAGLGGNAERLRQVWDNPLYSLAAGLTAPIFQAGRLQAGHALAQAQREELLAGYRQAVVVAFADVENALNDGQGAQAQLEAQAEEERQAQQALDYAERRYRAGADTLLVLLDAQRSLYTAQDAGVQLRLAQLQARVALYKALGGGWQAPATHVAQKP